jgi:AIG2-like family
VPASTSLTDANGPGPGAVATLTWMGLYAAYGSNMDPAQMLRRCPSSPFAGTGWIPGWRLTFGAEDVGWEGALATLVPAEDDSPGVFVALYDLTEADEKALDAWEGADHGLYRKVRLRVHTLAGDVVAFAYALDAFEGGLPSARYLGTIADAAEAAGAPDDYLADLRRRDCRSIPN